VNDVGVVLAELGDDSGTNGSRTEVTPWVARWPQSPLSGAGAVALPEPNGLAQRLPSPSSWSTARRTGRIGRWPWGCCRNPTA